MQLPNIDSLEIENKRVLIRLDLDVPINDDKIDDTRLLAGLPSIKKLLEKKASQIIMMGKIGRPDGKRDESLSTKQLQNWYSEKLSQDIKFASDFSQIDDSRIILFENLRFWSEEKSNNEDFAKKLASLGDCFINESFAVSHRESASIVGIPKLLPSAFGERFVAEVENLSRVFDNPERPVVVTLSGLKKDKLNYLDNFKEKADKILVAGRLGEYLGENYNDSKVTIAKLMQDKEDITLNTIEKFEEIVSSAKTILVSGPMGKFEEEGHRLGTERVFNKIASNETAFRVAGGGDTEHALDMLGLKDKFDWVSTGGGAMLEFLANGSLPGIEAILEN